MILCNGEYNYAKRKESEIGLLRTWLALILKIEFLK